MSHAHAVFRQKSVRGADIWCFQNLKSTSLFMKEQFKINNAFIPVNTCVWALSQSGGYGRLGRKWHSVEGEGLWFSVLLQAHSDLGANTRFPQVVALALAEWIESLGVTSPQIKWPNDLVVQNQKLAGLIVEKVGAYLVVGIGLNLKTNPERDFLLKRATIGLDALLNQNLQDKELELLSGFLSYLTNVIWLWEKSGLLPFVERIQKIDSLKGQKIRGLDSRIEGMAQGIDPNGSIQILQENGEIFYCFDSEVQIV